MGRAMRHHEFSLWVEHFNLDGVPFEVLECCDLRDAWRALGALRAVVAPYQEASLFVRLGGDASRLCELRALCPVWDAALIYGDHKLNVIREAFMRSSSSGLKANEPEEIRFSEPFQE